MRSTTTNLCPGLLICGAALRAAADGLCEWPVIVAGPSSCALALSHVCRVNAAATGPPPAASILLVV